METILFNIETNTSTNDEAIDLARTYRCLWRVSIVIAAVLSLVIGILLVRINHTPTKALIVTQTETEAAVVHNDMAEVVTEPMQTEPAAFFALTPEQRTLIEQVVSAESRGEPYDGQVAVAQCILNACLKDDITPERAVVKYKYTSARVEPTDSVKEAVAAVFDRGEGVTDEPILYFYAPAIVHSDFHESQTFVIEIKNHRFFKEAEQWNK